MENVLPMLEKSQICVPDNSIILSAKISVDKLDYLMFGELGEMLIERFKSRCHMILFQLPSHHMKKSLLVYVDNITKCELHQIVTPFSTNFEIVLTEKITLTQIIKHKLPFVYETPIKSNL